MDKWKSGNLRSGSKSGPKVKNRKQAIAIMLSEKEKSKGSSEYQSKDSLKGLKKAKPKDDDNG